MKRVDFLKQVSPGVILACALAVLTPTVAPAQEAPPRPFLRKVIQLDDAQLAAVEKGEVVTKLLPTTDKPEIAVFGVVKTAGTVDQLLALARDVKKFRQVPQIPEMGYFSTPAKLEDLKGLTHPPDDIAALKKCKPGSCDVKLGTKGLEMVSKIDWKAADAEKRRSRSSTRASSSTSRPTSRGARTRWATCSTRSRRSPAPRSTGSCWPTRPTSWTT